MVRVNSRKNAVMHCLMLPAGNGKWSQLMISGLQGSKICASSMMSMKDSQSSSAIALLNPNSTSG